MQDHQYQQYINRHKKKRVNYSTRTVELARGGKGFGFTISGQQPCILSCIMPGSPADLADLRSGDYLIAVNGHRVGKVPHDDVVRLISCSNGVLQLRIAENYYSDSSEEEAAAKINFRPKNRSRSSHVFDNFKHSSSLHPQCRIAKVVKDLQSGAMFDASTARISVRSNSHRWKMSSPLPPPPLPSTKKCNEKIVHRAVLGYLGTIDIPRYLQSISMMSIVKKCIKRIKAEKRNPTMVLLTIHVANIKLANMQGRVIAEYPSYRIIYCNSFSSEDKFHFGILTKSIYNYVDKTNESHENSSSSNSCHVFKIYSKLTDHVIHASTCATFEFACTKASELNNFCQEFPTSCDGLVGAIQTLYIANAANDKTNLFDNRRSHREMQPSPQSSNISTSTAHSSNSDSGIGFKDECSCHSDRNLNLECSSKYHDGSIIISSLGRIAKEQGKTKLMVRQISDPSWSDFLSGSSSASIYGHWQQLKEWRQAREQRGSNGVTGEGSIVSCPAVPSGRFTQRQNFAAYARLPRYTSTLSDVSKSAGSFFDVPDKLSPKVVYPLLYPVYASGTKPQGFSMENLKTETSPNFNSNFRLRTKRCDMTEFLLNNRTEEANDQLPRTWSSLQEIRKIADFQFDDCVHGSTESCDKTTICRTHTWTQSFEKLLEDPKGLQTFAKYLRKEISHENIYFWVACERYADTEDLTARKRLAAQIYQRHLSNNASEPVNVDSHAAGQITPELLNTAPTDLFTQTQKQVFNLMKFDSYPRFLRSEIYRKCLETGYDNEDILSEDRDLFLTNSPSIKLKKSHSDVEDRCRKSILPWHRKNRSKSKDRGESEYNKTPSRGEKIYKSFSAIQRDNEENNEDDNVSISSSRSSLASWDLALRQSFTKHSSLSCEGQSNEKQETHVSKCAGLCRVILPDGSTTVIPTSHSDSVRDVVTRLLDKRALRYSNYDVLMLATDEIINLKYPSSVLASQEVEVVPTKIIKVDLPSRRVISVIAHKGKTLKEILKPLLHKYGFKLDLVTIWADGHVVSIDIPAINSPARLALTSNNKEIIDNTSLFQTSDVQKGQPTLDEITNKVFEELRVGKSNNKCARDEGSFQSDDEKSEGSSNLSNKFFSKDSTLYFKRKSKSKNSNMNEKSNSDYGNESNRPHPPLIAKWRNGVKLQLPSKFNGDDLYEGLKRAQRLRLDDQRGIEINFELPEFLKNKENGKTLVEKKRRKSHGIMGNNEYSKFYDSDEGKPILEGCFDSSNSLDETLVDTTDKTIVENGIRHIDATKLCNQEVQKISPTKLSKPPPLPPKPKSLSNSLRSNVLPLKPFQYIINYDKKTV